MLIRWKAASDERRIILYFRLQTDSSKSTVSATRLACCYHVHEWLTEEICIYAYTLPSDDPQLSILAFIDAPWLSCYYAPQK